MPISEITMQDVYRARQQIASVAARTPLVHSPWLSEQVGSSVYLKLENLQPTGSFKIRGAANRMLCLTNQEKERGVITVSSGNHGQAVAYIAQRLGLRAVICVSARVPENKVDAIRTLGGEVVVHGNSYEEAEMHAQVLEREWGLTLVDPFDDPMVIAGQGTIGLEILEDLPDVSAVIVPLSGGGLMSGIALTVKSASAAIRTVGVSMERAPVMYHSLKAGKPIEMVEEDTLADALVGNIGLNNKYTFRMVRKYVDDAILVSEVVIAQAMACAMTTHRLALEGGGAVGIAALLGKDAAAWGRHIAVVISGGNVGIPHFWRIVEERMHQSS